jgi:geranylgeranyl reductase family protein
MNAVPDEIDVAVVGAGPAGSSAARILASHGAKVVLLDKATFPRYKTCGGGLLQRASRLMPHDLSSVVERDCRRAALSFVNHGLRFETRRDDPVIRMTMREKLDSLLVREAQRAGARLLDGCVLREVVHSSGRIFLRTALQNFRARFVIAADGANSFVARQGGWSPLTQRIPAVEYEIVPAERDFERFSEIARFDFEVVPKGYAWVFPKREHLSIGALTMERGNTDLDGVVQRYMKFLGLSQVSGVERHAYVIPVRPRQGRLARDGIFLTGDAAGLVDPVTAEGLTHAILSGQIAAKSIIDSQFDPETAATLYQTRVDRQIVRELKIARRLAWVLYEHPLIAQWFFRRHGQQLAEIVTDIVMGDQSYSGALDKALRFMFFFGRSRTRRGWRSLARANDTP